MAAVEVAEVVRESAPTTIDRLVDGICEVVELLENANGAFAQDAIPYFETNAGRCFYCARAMQHSAALLAAVTLAVEDLKQVSDGE